MAKICRIGIIGISLTLKRHPLISSHRPASAHHHPHHPLHGIKQIKRHIQQFSLLGSVDALMVYHPRRNPRAIASHRHAKQIYAPALRHPSALYHLHDFSAKPQKTESSLDAAVIQLSTITCSIGQMFGIRLGEIMIAGKIFLGTHIQIVARITI